jgi:hypothetical protein
MIVPVPQGRPSPITAEKPAARFLVRRIRTIRLDGASAPKRRSVMEDDR